MKFTAKTKDVANALKQAAYCLGSKAIVPILNNALFEASGDGFVTVTCTDLSQRITASFPAEVEIPETTTLPAKKLLSILNNLTSADITFDTKENHHTAIICGTTQIDICGLDVADFPDKTEVEPETSIDIETTEKGISIPFRQKWRKRAARSGLSLLKIPFWLPSVMMCLNNAISFVSKLLRMCSTISM